MLIELSLKNHCIETALKRFHENLMSTYFKTKGGNPKTEQGIEITGRLLTTLDFSMLRARFPDLAGHTDKEVALRIDADDRPRIFIAGKEITY